MLRLRQGLLLLLLLLLLLRLCLLLLQVMNLCHVMLGPLQAGVGQVASAHAGKDHGYHVRRDAVLERFMQHALFDPALLQA